MMKKFSLLVLIFLFGLTSGFGQIATIDFETAGDGYTSSATVGAGFTDVFNRANPNIGGNSTFMWAVEDVVNASRYIDIDQISVTGATSFSLDIDMLAHHYNDWDANTYVHIEYSLDGGTYQPLLWVETIINGTNAPAAIDTDFNGIGNCGATTTLPALSTGTADGCTVAASSDQFETFSSNSIALSGNSTLDIKLTFNDFSQADQGIYLDNIVIDVVGGTPTYAVTYDGNGNNAGTVPTDGNAYNAGDTVTVLGNTGTLTQSCGTFNNWNTAADGSGTSYSSGNTFTVTANTTLYAQYNSTANTVTFNSNGGTGTMTPQMDCTAATLTSNTFTNTGFTFNSWNTAADGSGTTYTDGASYDFSADITLYAQWDVYVGPCLSTGFESGEPSGWTNNDAYYNGGSSNSGTQKAGMNDDNDWIRTEQLLNPSSLRFWARASGSTSNYTIKVQYSTDATTWFDNSQILADGSNSGNITDAYQQFNINLNLTGNYYIRWLMNPRSGGSFYLDDVEVYCGTSTPVPELQLVDNTTANQNCGYTIDFGSQATATNTDLTFDIENIGSSDLNITSFGITGDYTIVSPAPPLTITAGNSETVTVRFTPTTTGTRTGVLTINNDDLDEGSCTVNLTGDGFIPVPEIDIERNTGASIANGSTASTGFNTVFAATTIGSSSAPKTFHISNEGTADLNVTSIVSSNSAEFAITLNPGASTITPATEIDFEITFSPTGVGLRTATITILSNDTDESPYTFNVQGNGNCSGASLTFLPDNGPVGTVVNITSSSSNFGSTTTATLGGVSATVTLISSSEIEVTIPTGIQTGSIEIDDDLGCLSSSLFTVIDQLISDCEGNTSTTPSDIFISEITDHGSGSHSYVELFNGTGASVDLSDYEIRIHGNGATTATGTIPLTGTLPNNEVFVVAFGGTESTINYASHGYDLTNNTSGVNSNDPIRLYKNTNTWVDLWGLADYTGDDYTIASKDYTYRRKNSGITAPSTTWNSTDWDSFIPVDYSDVGNYDFSTGVAPSVTVQPIAPTSGCVLTATISVTATEGFTGGNPLAYQWYYSAPGDTTWTVVTNNTTYSGAITDTLSILNTLNTIDYQFYCQVREDSATCYAASDAVKINVQKAEWDGTQWLDGITPDINTITIINGDYNTTTNGSFSACRLLVNATKTLTINSNDYVEIYNELDNDGIVTIEDSGSLIQINDVDANSGAITMKRNVDLRRLDYVLWSAPVASFNVVNVSPNSPTNRIYKWQPYFNTNDFGNWVTGLETMQAGKGYAVRGPSNFAETTLTQHVATFNGTPNNGSISTNIERGDYQGTGYTNPENGVLITNFEDNWNLIGNPYPSAINALGFLTDNTNIEGAIHIWTHATLPSAAIPDPFYDNFGSNYTINDYLVHNGSGTISGPSGFSGYIASGQGFFVKMLDGTLATEQVNFKNEYREKIVGYTNDNFYRNSQNTNEKHRIWLDLVNANGLTSRTLIGYINGATNQKDRIFDAYSDPTTEQHIYSIIDNEAVVIQGRQLPFTDIDVVPIGLQLTTSGLHHVAIAAIDGLFETENQTIYLKDNLLGLIHNLTENPYSFSSEAGVLNERFEIVYQPNTLGVTTNEYSNALTIVELQSGNVQFSVSNNLEIRNVKIYDVLGRLLYNLDGNSNKETYNLDSLSQAAYIAKVTLSNDVVVSKKAIKRN